MAKLRQWVGHSQVVIQPVLNMARRDAVDQHDPPEWMRELVELRDGHCVFPRCTVPAENCDKDHIVAYIPSRKADHPDRPTPTDSPACADDTTAPKPHASGVCPHARRPLPLVRPPRRHLPRHRHRHPPHVTVRVRGLLGEGAAAWGSPTPCRRARTAADPSADAQEGPASSRRQHRQRAWCHKSFDPRRWCSSSLARDRGVPRNRKQPLRRARGRCGSTHGPSWWRASNARRQAELANRRPLPHINGKSTPCSTTMDRSCLPCSSSSCSSPGSCACSG